MNSKLKKQEAETESLDKELKAKLDTIRALEFQVDTIPILRNKIKEFEKMSSAKQEASRVVSTANQFHLPLSTNSIETRKVSQQYNTSNFPISQENQKLVVSSTERFKENTEIIKSDLSR